MDKADYSSCSAGKRLWTPTSCLLPWAVTMERRGSELIHTSTVWASPAWKPWMSKVRRILQKPLSLSQLCGNKGWNMQSLSFLEDIANHLCQTWSEDIFVWSTWGFKNFWIRFQCLIIRSFEFLKADWWVFLLKESEVLPILHFFPETSSGWWQCLPLLFSFSWLRPSLCNLLAFVVFEIGVLFPSPISLYVSKIKRAYKHTKMTWSHLALISS